jgi:PAS domain-containing protein
MDLGPEDAVEIIELSSSEQLTHLFDLTAWDKEEFSPQRCEAWLPILLEAGPDKMAGWLHNLDMEALTLLGRHWFETVKFVASQEYQEPPEDLPEFTLDGIYFLEFHNPDMAALAAQTLVVLKSELPERYSAFMEAMRWEIDSELMEYARRWRQGRLQDQGFPLREDALALWALPRADEYNWRDKPVKYQASRRASASQDEYWRHILPDHELLPLSLADMAPEDLDSLKQELTYIANSGAVALNVDLSDAGAVVQAARESLSLVNLGLSILSQGDPSQARQILIRLNLDSLARHGAKAVRGLNKKAWRIMKNGWMKDLPTQLNLLDAPLDHWLAGLLFTLPRCYDQGNKPEYRAFVSLADISLADRRLDLINFCNKLMFELLGWTRLEVLAMLTAPAWPEDPDERKLSHLLGTWLARRALGLPGLQPLPANRLGRALKALQQGFQSSLAQEIMDSVYGLHNADSQAMAKELLDMMLLKLKQNLGRQRSSDPMFTTGLIIAKGRPRGGRP